MDVTVSDLNETIAKVVLAGKLDIQGAERVGLPLSTLSGSKTGIVVDMSAVSFIASIGIRHFVVAARQLARRGGRLVLLAPTDLVADVLSTADVLGLMDVAQSEDVALRLAGGGGA